MDGVTGMVPFQSTVWAEIEQAKNRDPEGYLRFVNRYRPAVVSFARSHGFSEAEAEDLAQDVFLRIFRGNVLSRVDPKKGKFRRLILAVAKNAIFKERRRRRTAKRGGDQVTVSLDDAECAAPGPSEEEEAAFDRMWAQQLVAAAMRQLAAANPQYYQALRLLLDDRSYADIARAMAKSTTEVSNYIRRAKAWIKVAVARRVAQYCASRREFDEEMDYLSTFAP